MSDETKPDEAEPVALTAEEFLKQATALYRRATKANLPADLLWRQMIELVRAAKVLGRAEGKLQGTVAAIADAIRDHKQK